MPVLWTMQSMSKTTGCRYKMSVPAEVFHTSVVLIVPFAGPFFFPERFTVTPLLNSVTLPLFFSSVEGSRRRRKWIW